MVLSAELLERKRRAGTLTTADLIGQNQLTQPLSIGSGYTPGIQSTPTTTQSDGQIQTPFDIAPPESTTGDKTRTIQESLDIFTNQFGAPGSAGVADVSATSGTQGALDAFNQFSAPTVDVPTGVSPIQGLSPEFFESKRRELTQNLQNEFLGPLGTVQKTASDINARGLLDSGVGKRLLREQALNPFAKAQADIETNIFQQQLEERARVEGVNQDAAFKNVANTLEAQGFNVESSNKVLDIFTTISGIDSTNELKASISNQETDRILQDLAARSAASDQGLLSAEEEVKLKNDIEVFRIAMDFKTNQDKLSLDLLQTPFPEDSENQQIFNELSGG